MKQNQNTRSLLQTLQGLYSKISALVLRRRTTTYDKAGGSKLNVDISSQLSAHIDKNVVPTDTKNNTEDGTDSTVKKGGAEPEESRRPAVKTSTASRIVSGLSKYFSNKRPSSIRQTYLSEKIKKTTWKHIHSALRLTKQNDIEAAKLNANIASHTLKEAANYMPEEEYAKFAAEVKEKLNTLLEDKGV